MRQGSLFDEFFKVNLMGDVYAKDPKREAAARAAEAAAAEARERARAAAEAERFRAQQRERLRQQQAEDERRRRARAEDFAARFGRYAHKAQQTGEWPVLGIPRSSTQDQIRAAYRKVAKLRHPDAGGNAAAFRELQNEYDKAMKGAKV